ncbi:hypothetical protein BDY17DRAFT_310534 [Neohortaea acidophila]|uniref:Uncharacterized protein n=1 Tax=Neohortaea acidophila TaxID=245834 RepID=A0A6A6PV09_9PEZI|nr:uncharacterized protein BDY17DRAFT_310534 [Neohortaea acidophila]KAF2483554.1 hypothetical protein BDY17DRAFT_310534 [Neohortaea acidophila]
MDALPKPEHMDLKPTRLRELVVQPQPTGLDAPTLRELIVLSSHASRAVNTAIAKGVSRDMVAVTICNKQSAEEPRFIAVVCYGPEFHEPAHGEEGTTPFEALEKLFHWSACVAFQRMEQWEAAASENARKSGVRRQSH